MTGVDFPKTFFPSITPLPPGAAFPIVVVRAFGVAKIEAFTLLQWALFSLADALPCTPHACVSWISK